MNSTVRAAVIGASGYSGQELLGILLRHPQVKIGSLFAHSKAGNKLADISPRFSGRIDATLNPYSAEAASAHDIIFSALPSGQGMELLGDLADRGKSVIDLSGDFRLQNPVSYQHFYGRPCKVEHLLPEAVYGLPEQNRAKIQEAHLLANPGCYPTSAIIPLLPLLRGGLIEHEHIAISSMSGVSGAGRSASPELSFCEVNETVRAYKVGNHQHIPEIRAALEQDAGKPVSFTFTPHLIPITRGIYTTSAATLRFGVNEEHILSAYRDAFRDEPFVRVSSTEIPEIRNVLHTNYIDIGFCVQPEENRVIIMSAIDNLVKGAAGQAVQNMNIMFGFGEAEGLH
jgi:N-acetyl-gamma-glutamyl-phosphate reductase